MKITYSSSTSKNPTAYLCKSYKDENGTPYTDFIETIGTLEEIKAREGCEDPKQWCKEYARRLTEEENKNKRPIKLEVPAGHLEGNERAKLMAGDLFILPIYRKLGLDKICDNILKNCRARFDLDSILQMLVTTRILYPTSKINSYRLAQNHLREPNFSEDDMYRALSLLGQIEKDEEDKDKGQNKEQTQDKGQDKTQNKTQDKGQDKTQDKGQDKTQDKGQDKTQDKTQDKGQDKTQDKTQDKDKGQDKDKNKKYLIYDIQAQMFTNSLSFLKRETTYIFYDCSNYYFHIDHEDPDIVTSKGKIKYGFRKKGLSKEGRKLPIVQMGLIMDYDAIPIAFILFPGNQNEQASLIELEEILANKFDLDTFVISLDAGLGCEENRRYNITEGREYIVVQPLRTLAEEDIKAALNKTGWRVAYRDPEIKEPIDPENPEREIFNLDEIDKDREIDTRFYKEVPITKRLKGDKKTARKDRLIVTYNENFAQWLSANREAQIAKAREKVEKAAAQGDKVKKKRGNNEDRFIKKESCTKDGEVAAHETWYIDEELIEQEKRFDGFYGFCTSLSEKVPPTKILKIRGFHYEIEHLFRTTKTNLRTRPVYVRLEERIAAHFLICFIALTIIKILQKILNMKDLSVDELINGLRNIEYYRNPKKGYVALFKETALTKRLEEIYPKMPFAKYFISYAEMRKMYKCNEVKTDC